MPDETMSQDTAFTTENDNKDTFKFDEVKDSSPDSQSNEENKGDDSASDEDNKTDVEGSDEQKVPYSRFKKVVDERNETAEKISYLEQRLQEIEDNRTEQPADDMPVEWVKLYGDSDASKEAWAIQKIREEELAARIESRTIERFESQRENEVVQLQENEQTIDENLNALEEAIGKKITEKQEEEILGIVDEFSPVGDDGKYITLFPFDKAYEIYALRQSQKGQGTRDSRRAVADLTGNSSEGDVDPSNSAFKRGWDSWRDGI